MTAVGHSVRLRWNGESLKSRRLEKIKMYNIGAALRLLTCMH